MAQRRRIWPACVKSSVFQVAVLDVRRTPVSSSYRERVVLRLVLAGFRLLAPRLEKICQLTSPQPKHSLYFCHRLKTFLFEYSFRNGYFVYALSGVVFTASICRLVQLNDCQFINYSFGH